VNIPNSHEMNVEAEVRAPVATAQLVHFHFQNPVENVMREQQSYRFDLCLTPRPSNARASYHNRWGSHRFERIGNLFVVPPGASLHARSDGCCEQTSVLCHIDPQPIREWLDDTLPWTDRGLSAGLDIRDRNIHSLLLRLAEEVRNPGFASEMLLELIAAQMAIELARYCTQSGERPTTGGLASWRLRRIDARLREENSQPTLAELAQLCGVSNRQLTRGFRESRGCSIGDFVANDRAEQAKQRLATDESIKSIAYSLGFASPSSFCFAFRRATGEAPGVFRQRLRRIH
jgi:AraC family transcriptional regulator